jgi:exodeoxyribonuclease VII small subunit
MADIADMVKWTAKDVAELRYEQLRDALDEVVTALEDADMPLEELMKLWEIGEKLAAECEAQLTRARERIEAKPEN